MKPQVAKMKIFKIPKYIIDHKLLQSLSLRLGSNTYFSLPVQI